MEKKKYILITIIACALASCSDFLEPQSQSEYTPKDIAALNELLLGEAIPSQGTVSARKIIGLIPLLDDDITGHPYVAPNAGKYPAYYFDPAFLALRSVFTWQPDYSRQMEGRVNEYDLYTSHYQYILGCNAVLDHVDKVTGSTKEKEYVKAQALTLRGYYYFQLVNIYGIPYNKDKNGLGVPLKTISDLENRHFPRNSVAEVYEQIEKDLLEAERIYAGLSGKQLWNKNYRPSLPMLQLLLSRMYLFMENWDKAALYASKVMNDWDFDLINLQTLPTTSSKPYYDFKTYESPESIWVFGFLGTDLTIHTAKMFSTEGGAISSNVSMFEASDELLNSFEDGDLRKSNYIVQRKETGGRISYRAYGKISVTSTSLPNGSGNPFGQALRLSEAYLIYAEANAMLFKNGNSAAKQESMNALNDLRKKRFENAKYVDLPDMNADELIKFVREERRRELCFEAFRWFDLRRYGMPEIKHRWEEQDPLETPAPRQIYTLIQGDNSYTLPIPHTILEQNSSLIQSPLAPPREPSN